LVAARTRELMDARGLGSIRKLATAAGLGNGTISDILSGSSDPTLSTMLALVRALGLGSIEELLSPLGTSLVIGAPYERTTSAP
jgi:DNA-binding phage protein